MIRLGSQARVAAATVAVAINLGLVGGLLSLAQHYAERAAQGIELANRAQPAPPAQASALRCIPEPRRAG